MLHELSTNNPRVTKERRVLYDLTIALVVSCLLIGTYKYISHINKTEDAPGPMIINEMAEKAKLSTFGFDHDDYFFEESIIKSNQFLGDILYQSGISYSLIAELELKAKEVYDVRKIRAGKYSCQ